MVLFAQWQVQLHLLLKEYEVQCCHVSAFGQPPHLANYTNPTLDAQRRFPPRYCFQSVLDLKKLARGRKRCKGKRVALFTRLQGHRRTGGKAVKGRCWGQMMPHKDIQDTGSDEKVAGTHHFNYIVFAA